MDGVGTGTIAGLFLDTGDLVVFRRSTERAMVACAHYSDHPRVWLIGHKPGPYFPDDLILLEKATPEARLAQLQAMAGSSSTNHRAVCARAQIAAGAATDA